MPPMLDLCLCAVSSSIPDICKVACGTCSIVSEVQMSRFVFGTSSVLDFFVGRLRLQQIISAGDVLHSGGRPSCTSSAFLFKASVFRECNSFLSILDLRGPVSFRPTGRPVFFASRGWRFRSSGRVSSCHVRALQMSRTVFSQRGTLWPQTWQSV